MLEGSVCMPFIIVITGPHSPSPGIIVKLLIVHGTPIVVDNIAGRNSGICLTCGGAKARPHDLDDYKREHQTGLWGKGRQLQACWKALPAALHLCLEGPMPLNTLLVTQARACSNSWHR